MPGKWDPFDLGTNAHLDADVCPHNALWITRPRYRQLQPAIVAGTAASSREKDGGDALCRILPNRCHGSIKSVIVPFGKKLQC